MGYFVYYSNLSNQLLKLQSENERLEEELSEKRKVRLKTMPAVI